MRVRLRLLPWRPRWRAPEADGPSFDVPDLGFDDPVSAVIGFLLLLFLAPFVLVFVLGVVLFSAEILLLLALLPLLMLGQVLGLLPWVLSVREANGDHRYVEVRGTRRMLATWRSLRA